MALAPARFLLPQVPGQLFVEHGLSRAPCGFAAVQPSGDFRLGPANCAYPQLDGLGEAILSHFGIDGRTRKTSLGFHGGQAKYGLHVVMLHAKRPHTKMYGVGLKGEGRDGSQCPESTGTRPRHAASPYVLVCFGGSMPQLRSVMFGHAKDFGQSRRPRAGDGSGTQVNHAAHWVWMYVQTSPSSSASQPRRLTHFGCPRLSAVASRRCEGAA